MLIKELTKCITSEILHIINRIKIIKNKGENEDG